MKKAFLFLALTVFAQGLLANTVTINVKQGKRTCRYYVENYRADKTPYTPGFEAQLAFFPQDARTLFDSNYHSRTTPNGCLNIARIDLVVNEHYSTKADRKLAIRISEMLNNGTIDELNINLANAKSENEGEQQLVTWQVGNPNGSEKRKTIQSRRQNVTVNLNQLTNSSIILEKSR